jgi:hypothetical protein
MSTPKPTKPHIKQAAYADERFSALEAHARKGKTLASPYSKLPGPVSFTSWKDDFLPNMLWATVVAAALPREEYLEAFRAIGAQLQKVSQPESTMVMHTWLSTLSREDFLVLVDPLRKFPAAYAALASLRLIDSLPDKDHWKAFVPEEMPEHAWDFLGRGVALSFDQHGQTATDIRWLKVIAMIITGKMQFPEAMHEREEELRLYPNKGDMRAVRPSIRATEMAVRGLEIGRERPAHIPESDPEAFWIECRAKTECIVEPRRLAEGDHDGGALLDQLTKTSIALAEHVDSVVPGSGVDPRRDAGFGLVLYAINIAMELAASKTHILAGGRNMLRTMVEAVITLRYLAAKDDPTIWKQYRSYGMGQAKLAFLKNVREEDIPEFIALEDLHTIANDDMWLEFVDIELGSWGKLDLRKMSETGGAKDLYDKYYSWASGFTHAQWNAVRDTTFTTCFNPLHRYHRVFAPMRPMPSVLPDCCKLINRMLDDINTLYPSFKVRIDWHKRGSDQTPS